MVVDVERQGVGIAPAARLGDDAPVVGIERSRLCGCHCHVRPRSAERGHRQRELADRGHGIVLEADGETGAFGIELDDAGAAFDGPHHRSQIQRLVGCESRATLLDQSLDLLGCHRGHHSHRVCGGNDSLAVQIKVRTHAIELSRAVENERSEPHAVVGGSHDGNVSLVPVSIEPGDGSSSNRQESSPVRKRRS